MEKKLFLIIGIILSLASMISAGPDSIGIFKNGESINISNYCSTADCTYMYLESITYPNGSILLLNASMNQIGQEFFYEDSFDNYGTYWFRTCSDPRGIAMCERDYFIINPTGTEFTIAQGFLFSFIILLIGMFLFFSINGIRKAENGAWFIAYVCITYILIYILVGVCYLLAGDYLWASPIIENILFIIWIIMGVGLLPFIIVVSLIILKQEARAALEQDYMKNGYTREEAKDLSKNNKR